MGAHRALLLLLACAALASVAPCGEVGGRAVFAGDEAAEACAGLARSAVAQRRGAAAADRIASACTLAMDPLAVVAPRRVAHARRRAAEALLGRAHSGGAEGMLRRAWARVTAPRSASADHVRRFFLPLAAALASIGAWAVLVGTVCQRPKLAADGALNLLFPGVLNVTLACYTTCDAAAPTVPWLGAALLTLYLSSAHGALGSQLLILLASTVALGAALNQHGAGEEHGVYNGLRW